MNKCNNLDIMDDDFESDFSDSNVNLKHATPKSAEKRCTTSTNRRIRSKTGDGVAEDPKNIDVVSRKKKRIGHNVPLVVQSKKRRADKGKKRQCPSSSKLKVLYS